jgi:hypothetical protein
MNRVKTFWLYCVVVIAFSFTTVSEAQAQSDWIEKVSNKSLPSVVTITAFNGKGEKLGLGSGFIIAEDGVLVTNYHVIKEASTAEVRNRSIGKYFVYGVLTANRQMDYAVLKIRAQNLPTIKIGDSSKTRLGEGIVAIGNPKGLDGTISTGVISQFRNEGRFAMLQISAPIYPGNSGGPLLNKYGEVIGLVSARLGDNATLGFALPINYVNRALQEKQNKIYSLSQIVGAESAIAAEEKKAEAQQFIKNNFQIYQNPSKLFDILLPKNWTIQHESGWTKNRETYYDQTLIAPANARLAQVGGYLSDGIRITLQLPPSGRVWTEKYRKDYTDNFPKGLIENNPGFALTDKTFSEVGGVRATVYSFVGRDKRLPEPEETVFYILPLPNAIVRIELTTPMSKREALQLLQTLVTRTFELKIEH